MSIFRDVEQVEQQRDPGGQGLSAWLSRTGRDVFYVDLRSIAALRICLGLLILGDLITRAFHFEAHYTDLGVAPREVILDQFGWASYCSIHWWMAGSTVTEAAVFMLSGLFAVALIVGWHTRIATMACWYMQASLLTRLPLLHTAGDRTLLLMLFWLILLPAAARWSLDAARHPERSPASNTYVSFAGFGALMQVSVIYWVSIILKLTSPMWIEGRAVQFALTRDSYATELAQWVVQFETLLPMMTLAVMAWGRTTIEKMERTSRNCC